MGELIAASLDGKMLWGKLGYLAICVLTPSWLLFAAAHTGILPRRIVPLLYVLPAFTVTFVALAPGLPLVWTSTELVRSGDIVTLGVGHGPWFWVHVLYTYGIVFLGATLLVGGIVWRTRRLTAQGVVVATAALLPLAVNACCMAFGEHFHHLDFTPPAFAVSVVLLLLSIDHMDFLHVFPALVPIAYSSVLDQLQDGVVVLDAEQRVLSANPAAATILGGACTSVMGRRFDDCIELRDEHGEVISLAAAADAGRHVRVTTAHRSEMIAEAVISRLGSADRASGYALVVRDVSEREAITRRLQDSRERLHVLFEQSPMAIVVFDRDLIVTECNDQIAAMYGVSSQEEIIGHSMAEASSPGFVEQCRAALRGEVSSYDGPFVLLPGEQTWLQCRISPLRAADEITGAMCVAWDVTGVRRAKAEIEHLTFHDTLTDLPNRLLFGDRLRQALTEARGDGESVAVALLDLDRFKMVNEAVGHSAADGFLREVAQRLSAVAPSGHTLARFGGDELALLMPRIGDARAAMRTGETVLEAVRAPWTVGDATLSVTASMGVAVFPSDGVDSQTLLDNAGSALQRARAAGGDRQQFYDLSMNLEAAERLTTEQELRVALDEGQLRAFYEPQVSLVDGTISAVEALVRWEHPQRGMVPPLEFISVAEGMGIIGRLTEWMLMRACSDLVERDAVAGGELSVSVNVSPRDLQSEEVVGWVREALEKTGLAPHRLRIEITETAFIDDLLTSLGILEQIRRLGVGIDLDDFGAGYASLSQLLQLPIDRAKIDRSFIARCDEDEGAASVVASIIGLCRTLSLGVVAEGVETAAQAAILRKLGCEVAQGYLFSRPQPADEAPAFRPGARVTVP